MRKKEEDKKTAVWFETHLEKRPVFTFMWEKGFKKKQAEKTGKGEKEIGGNKNWLKCSTRQWKKDLILLVSIVHAYILSNVSTN